MNIDTGNVQENCTAVRQPAQFDLKYVLKKTVADMTL